MISDRIYDENPPQKKILNTVFPFLMHFSSLISNLSVASWHKAAHHPTKFDVINGVKLLPTVYSQFFDVIQSDVALQKKLHYNYLLLTGNREMSTLYMYKYS